MLSFSFVCAVFVGLAKRGLAVSEGKPRAPHCEKRPGAAHSRRDQECLWVGGTILLEHRRLDDLSRQVGGEKAAAKRTPFTKWRGEHQGGALCFRAGAGAPGCITVCGRGGWEEQSWCHIRRHPRLSTAIVDVPTARESHDALNHNDHLSFLEVCAATHGSSGKVSSLATVVTWARRGWWM